MSKPKIEIGHEDAPMDCCGLLEGFGFSNAVDTGEKREGKRTIMKDGKFIQVATGYYHPILRPPNLEDQVARLKSLEKIAHANGRSCIIISLAAHQETALEAVKIEGWTMLHEFYNNNSGHMVYLYCKTFPREYEGDDE